MQERSARADPRVADELGAVTAAERQVLVLLQDRVAGKSPKVAQRKPLTSRPAWEPEAYFPAAESLAVIARLVVHLARVRAIKVRRAVPLAVDYVIVISTLMVVLFSAGWTASNTLTRLSVPILVPGTILVVVFVGRVTAVVVIRLPALRFRRLVRRKQPRYAVEATLNHELPQLVRWRQRAERLDRPALAHRLTAEMEVVDDLRREVEALTAKDLDWAMRTRWSASAVPKARYEWALSVATMRYLAGLLLIIDTGIEYRWLTTVERLLGIPLTARGAGIAANDRLERSMRLLLDSLDEPPLVGSIDGRTRD